MRIHVLYITVILAIMALQNIILQPQAGPQTQLCSSRADIRLFGGGAGGGKSYVICLDKARYVQHPGFSAVIFRRTYPDIMNPGGLWDTSMMIYPYLGGKPKVSRCEWEFPSGATIKFSHLQHQSDVLSWQGAQIPIIDFDELTHFTEYMFWYMTSRNRMSAPLPMRPYMDATCNPDSTSWVRKLVDWWIDKETGLAIPERSGALRWFIRDGDHLKWADSKEEAYEKYGRKDLPLDHEDQIRPRSLTFIASKLSDNPALVRNDPEYRARLQALPLVERLQLLGCNWNVLPTSGMFFKKFWFPTVKQAPVGGRTVRYWDRAASEPTAAYPDPDWTVGTLMRLVNGRVYVIDVCRDRVRPEGVKRMMRNCADQDGPEVEVWAEEDPGSAGKSEVDDLSRMFLDRPFYSNRVSKDKATRAKPMSAAAESGNITVVEGVWNDEWLREYEMFMDTKILKQPEGYHDDQVDSGSGGYNVLVSGDEPRISRL